MQTSFLKFKKIFLIIIRKRLYNCFDKITKSKDIKQVSLVPIGIKWLTCNIDMLLLHRMIDQHYPECLITRYIQENSY